MLVDRDPSEAPHLTQRICGVCSVPHGAAAAMALEKAAKSPIPENARVLRNLVMGANFIQSHILHFYQLSLLDYVGGPGMPPWEPQWNVDRRIGAEDTTRLVDHYKLAFKAVRQTNEMAAVFAGRQPHSPAFVPGGFTNVPTADQVAEFRKYCEVITDFIRNVYAPDVDFVASQYPEYNQLGRGYGNLLVFGGFPLDAAGKGLFFASGRVTEGGRSPNRCSPRRLQNRSPIRGMTTDRPTATPPPVLLRRRIPKRKPIRGSKRPGMKGSPTRPVLWPG
jgi:hydrogenase large subunit